MSDIKEIKEQIDEILYEYVNDFAIDPEVWSELRKDILSVIDEHLNKEQMDERH